MKKLIILSVVFAAIALLPQEVMAQQDQKTDTQKVRVEKQKHKRGDVVPVRKNNQVVTKNTKTEAQTPVKQEKAAVKKAEKTDEKVVGKQIMRNGDKKEIIFIDKKKKKAEKKKTIVTKEIEKQ